MSKTTQWIFASLLAFSIFQPLIPATGLTPPAIPKPSIFQWIAGAIVVAGGVYLQWPEWRANWLYYQNSRFIRAAHRGDIKAVTSYLKAGYTPVVRGKKNWEYINVLGSDDFEYSCRMFAVQRINAGYGMGRYMPFIEAAREGHAKIVHLMLQNDEKKLISQEIKDSALYVAVRKGHASVVKILLDAKANPITTDFTKALDDIPLNASTALRASVDKDTIEIFELLFNSLSNFTSLECSSSDKATITRICYGKKIKKPNFSVFCSFDSPFLRSIHHQKLGFLKIMLEKPNAVSPFTLLGGLYLACQLNQKKAIRMIVDYKINILDHMLDDLREQYPFTFEQVYDEFKNDNALPLIQPIINDPQINREDGDGNITRLINGYV